MKGGVKPSHTDITASWPRLYILSHCFMLCFACLHAEAVFQFTKGVYGSVEGTRVAVVTVEMAPSSGQECWDILSKLVSKHCLMLEVLLVSDSGTSRSD